MKWRRMLGKISEGLAAWVYRLKGYRVLDRNWTKQWAELDLVVVKKAVLVIVEVRSRSSGGLVDALESFDHGKRQRFIRAVRLYLHMCQKEWRDVRCELFCVTWVSIMPLWLTVSLPSSDSDGQRS